MGKEDEMNAQRLERKKLHVQEVRWQPCGFKEGCDGELHLQPVSKVKGQPAQLSEL